MRETSILLLLSTLVLFGAATIYILPLRKRDKWLWWMPVMFLLNLACMALNNSRDGMSWALGQLLQYGCLVLTVNRCTKLSIAADCYCAVWILVTGEAVHELWMSLRAFTPALHATVGAQVVSMLVFTAACYVVISLTAARWMPDGDIYQIGPRQLISALLLGGLCVILSRYFLLPQEIHFGKALVYMLCQLYCISLLYLQTELFKKSKLEKDLEALNFLYSREAQQYAAARQNVQAVTRKCEELEQMITRMQQYLPDNACPETQSSIDDALRACDTNIKSGNGVLDIVLTEKILLAEAYGIQVSCVADGKLLNFMEVVDIYALFSNALDNAIEAVRKLPDKDHRIIDVLIHENQNFLVINISNPMKESQQPDGEFPGPSRGRASLRGYGLRVLFHAVEKYHGIFHIEKRGGFFTLKVLIPLAQKEK